MYGWCYVILITSRNEVVAKVMFLLMSVIVHRGVLSQHALQQVSRRGVLSQHALQVVSQHALQQVSGGCLLGGGAWSGGVSAPRGVCSQGCLL